MSTQKKKMTFDDKIVALKQMHARSHPDAKRQISEWEDRMSQLQIQTQWLKHPNTTALRTLAEEQLQAISARLSEEETMPDEERKALFKAKNVHIVYLAVLTGDPEAEIETIEGEVDAEL